MKTKLKNKLITTAMLLLAVIAVVEFQKYTKRLVPECADGVCRLPAEQAGAIIGPQSVPMLLSPSQAESKPLPRLIDFGAESCATCKMMAAVLEELAGEYDNRLTIQMINTLEDKESAEEYSIRMIPTQVFLDAEGNELFRHEGFISKEDILKKWAELGVDFSNE